MTEIAGTADVARDRVLMQPGLRTIGTAILVAAAYYAGTEMGLAMTLPEQPISTMWPPNAILLGALLLLPRRVWWISLLAVLPAHLLVQGLHGIPLPTSLGWFVSNTGEAVLGAWCLTRVMKPGLIFCSLKGVVVFIVFGVVLAPLVTSFVDAAVVVGTGLGQDYWALFQDRLVSNMLASLTIVPPIVRLGCGGASMPARYGEIVGVGLGILLVVEVLFAIPNQSPHSIPILIYTLLPLLLWAAVRFGPTGLSIAMLATATLLIWNASHGRGPFTSGTVADNVRSLQLFLGVLTLPLLVLAAMMRERIHQQALQRAVLAALHELVAIVDRGGVIVAVNEPWLTVASTSGLVLVDGVQRGANYLELCRSAADGDNLAAKALDGITAVLKGLEPGFHLEYERTTPSQTFWYAISARPLSLPEGGAVITHSDVTSAKAAQIEAVRLRQELTHASRVMTMGVLSGALAHELSQPLTAILINARAAQRVLKNEGVDLGELGETLDDIVTADKRAADVVSRLRALMMPGEPRPQRLDSNAVIRDVLDLVHSELIMRRVRVRLLLTPALPPVFGDRVQVQQVVLNLILNACDAMADAAPPNRHVTIATALTDCGSVCVSVADRGTGVAADSLERVFEPFFTSKQNRLGLGLSICRSIVASHGGRLWAANNAQGGASFQFELPGVMASAFVDGREPRYSRSQLDTA